MKIICKKTDLAKAVQTVAKGSSCKSNHLYFGVSFAPGRKRGVLPYRE